MEGGSDDDGAIEHSAQDLADRRDHVGTVLGLAAVLAACFSSGFAGVYFEKMLHGVKSSLWLRNIQLALVAICLGLPATLFQNSTSIFGTAGTADADGDASQPGSVPSPTGFFQGYNAYVWAAIGCHATSGIVVALVIKYAGNLTKCLASAVAIIVSTLVSYFILDDVTLTPQFIVGGVVVVAAVFLYNMNWVSTRLASSGCTAPEPKGPRVSLCCGRNVMTALCVGSLARSPAPLDMLPHCSHVLSNVHGKLQHQRRPPWDPAMTKSWSRLWCRSSHRGSSCERSASRRPSFSRVLRR